MGEFYPIRKDIFKKTYIEVTEEVKEWLKEKQEHTK
jgi:hypothetical protein